MMKKCYSCKKIKPFNEFHKNKKLNDGHATDCKNCVSEIRKIRYNRKKEEIATKSKIYRTKNREVLLAKKREYYYLNKSENNARKVKYMANKIKATPLWFEKEKINNLYELALKIRNWGCDVAIDHIVPLNSPIVCGLHCLNNLQILTSIQNGTKSNTFN